MESNVKTKSLYKSLAYASLGIGIAYLIVKHRNRVLNFFTNTFSVNKNPYSIRKIVIVNTEEDCKKITELLRKKCLSFHAVGFDCEWVTVHGNRKPVALVQLASQDGLCALFRICQLKRVPPSLKALLEDRTILKVGVAPLGDANNLLHDYNVQMHGCVDLRHLAREKRVPAGGLSFLSEKVVGERLEKNWRVVCSDWEAETLSVTQQKYAALDALAGILIFIGLLKKGLSIWERTVLQRNMNDDDLSKVYQYSNVEFKEGRRGNSSYKPSNKLGTKTFTRSFSTRQALPYDNCFLLAPDGELLSTITKRKVEWYMSRGLATEVSTDPLTIRLCFEPADRNVDGDWEYYKLKKENMCVVCGGTESLLMKRIVPSEYRKLFPDLLKQRRSHDILVLCLQCHLASNFHDQDLRRRLADICDASTSSPKVLGVREVKEIRSFARALTNPNKDKIPLERREEMLNKIREFYKEADEITPEILEELSNINLYNSNIIDENYVSHAKKVVDHFSKSGASGLLELERMCRRHFLERMEPRFLPDLWSVDHGHGELMEKLSAYDKGTNTKLYGGEVENVSYTPKSTNKTGYKPSRRCYVRSTVPHEDCKLLSPEGELLSVITKRKVKWYLSKGLATEVSSDPLTIQLNSNSVKHNLDGSWKYYTQKIANMCVVCGSTESLVMKNILPLEYRKYFPDVIKLRRSHDILVFCIQCMLASGSFDLELRRHLAELCDAQIVNKVVADNTVSQIRSFAKALIKKDNEKIPQRRREEMVNRIREYCGKDEITLELLEELSTLDIYKNNENYIQHGKKVVEHFYKSSGVQGLFQLERMWREHFLNTMKPRFLPQLWSVDHGHEEEVSKKQTEYDIKSDFTLCV